MYFHHFLLTYFCVNYAIIALEKYHDWWSWRIAEGFESEGRWRSTDATAETTSPKLNFDNSAPPRTPTNPNTILLLSPVVFPISVHRHSLVSLGNQWCYTLVARVMVRPTTKRTCSLLYMWALLNWPTRRCDGLAPSTGIMQINEWVWSYFSKDQHHS